jgi:hypothetical protein
VYYRILELASQRASEPNAIISADAIEITAEDTLIVPPIATRPRIGEAVPVTYRISKRARDVGDWAERVVLRFIQEQMTGCSKCVHRAAINETPGSDIGVDPVLWTPLKLIFEVSDAALSNRLSAGVSATDGRSCAIWTHARGVGA